ncbi:tryptophan 2,3-dioxygenase [Saccharospirillum alexandrii]|uniref:tryptophan 2,3-dioxygenase n=1 Tax=Saccharospirillum alexandrii TaxID=2448477 RepID=UPI000FDAC2BA|nr:tryptophan 2,3-dioxygenase family protein [Saccharospirillum alexandrii]
MLTYAAYLEVDDLIDLQHPKSDPEEHDEMLFIIIHQTYELWFKQVRHELGFLTERLDEGALPRASHTLKRILKIFKTLVSQIDILETMTPLEFESFRSRLDTASGFQSYQFRAIEFALGYKRPQPLTFQPEGSVGRAMLEDAYHNRSLWQVFMQLLARRGYTIPEAVTQPEPTAATAANAQVQEALLTIYQTDHELASLCELLVDLDEGLQEWRYRHVKMVQRTIGAKMGSGGSSGAEYLMNTLFKPVFPDLWEIRARIGAPA